MVFADRGCWGVRIAAEAVTVLECDLAKAVRACEAWDVRSRA